MSYSVVTSSGVPPFWGRRNYRGQRDAMKRADDIGGRVIAEDGWTVIYQSKKDKRRNGVMGGGGSAAPTEKVDPPESMFTPGAYQAYLAQ